MEIQTKRNGGAMLWLVKPRYIKFPMKNGLFMMIIRMILTAICSHFEKKQDPHCMAIGLSVCRFFLFIFLKKSCLQVFQTINDKNKSLEYNYNMYFIKEDAILMK